MPRIPDITLDGVQFLYRTEDDAKKHTRIGGTCFAIGNPLIVDGKYCNVYVPYLVSNRHVVWNAGCSVVRVNRRDGGEPEVFDLEPDKWVVHPNGDDIAIAPTVGLTDQAVQRISFLSAEKFLTPASLKAVDLGVGEEVIMVGRHVNHQGKRESRPIARFGSISMMPEPIWNKALGRDQDSFAVEMRSRTGFSGSPVTVYRTPATTLAPVPVPDFYMLLGVNWGYIFDEEGENSWLNGVVPAWKILETLWTPELMKVQKNQEDLWREAMKADAKGQAEPSVAGLADKSSLRVVADKNPRHLEDFKSLLNAAAKTKPQGD
jgi:hypothetical protein